VEPNNFFDDFQSPSRQLSTASPGLNSKHVESVGCLLLLAVGPHIQGEHGELMAVSTAVIALVRSPSPQRILSRFSTRSNASHQTPEA